MLLLLAWRLYMNKHAIKSPIWARAAQKMASVAGIRDLQNNSLEATWKLPSCLHLGQGCLEDCELVKFRDLQGTR